MNPRTDRNAWLGLGMASLVLGFIGMLLFFLPILGIPIAALGLAIGIVGLILALFSTWSSLRWSLGGIALCCLTLGVDLAIWFAPEGYIPRSLRSPDVAVGPPQTVRSSSRFHLQRPGVLMWEARQVGR